MIKINLAPVDELENPWWWLPEVVTFALVLGLGYLAITLYFEAAYEQIHALEAERVSFENSIKQLAKDIDRYDLLKKQVDDLSSKFGALQAMTQSKIARYRPVILMEHLQNLKPEGVWFDSLSMLMDGSNKSAKKEIAPQIIPNTPQQEGSNIYQIKINGLALDNIIVAEFLSALKATQVQEVASSDLRSQIYFDIIGLEQSELKSGTTIDPSLEKVIEFILTVTFKERIVPTTTNEQQIVQRT